MFSIFLAWTLIEVFVMPPAG